MDKMEYEYAVRLPNGKLYMTEFREIFSNRVYRPPAVRVWDNEAEALEFVVATAAKLESYGVHFLGRVERRVCGPWSDGHDFDANALLDRGNEK